MRIEKNYKKNGTFTSGDINEIFDLVREIENTNVAVINEGQNKDVYFGKFKVDDNANFYIEGYELECFTWAEITAYSHDGNHDDVVIKIEATFEASDLNRCEDEARRYD